MSEDRGVDDLGGEMPEVVVDEGARERHRWGKRWFPVAVVGYVPVVILVLVWMREEMGRGAVREYAGVLWIGGFLVVCLTWVLGVRDALVYWCPRCGRRLGRADAEGEGEPNVAYHCPDCRVVWDLGWKMGRP